MVLFGGRDFDCQQAVGTIVTAALSAEFPVPQLTSVTGCTDVGTGTFNCSLDATLTVHGSGFITFAYPPYGFVWRETAGDCPRKWYNQATIVDDSTIVMPLTKGDWPAASANCSFVGVFNSDQRYDQVYGNGSVTFGMAEYTARHGPAANNIVLSEQTGHDESAASEPVLYDK